MRLYSPLTLRRLSIAGTAILAICIVAHLLPVGVAKGVLYSLGGIGLLGLAYFLLPPQARQSLRKLLHSCLKTFSFAKSKPRKVQSNSPASATVTETASEPYELSTDSPEDESLALVTEMLAAERAALLLKPAVAPTLSHDHRLLAEEQLEEAMALVPAGPVILTGHGTEELCDSDRLRAEHRMNLIGFFLDRSLVTNQQYQRFVDDGGYENLALWDQVLWPAVLRFVDQTGQSGPRFWKDGTFPAGRANHPVVGVCWYEATAYARWAGKRLPTDPEWVRAASWPLEAATGQTKQLRYPWGDVCEARHANLWHANRQVTVPVQDYAVGDNPCGIHQLIGNVWEWTSSNFGCWDPAPLRLETEIPMKALRGGAFDTYFETQAQAQFQSGDSPLTRKENIGFRCAATIAELLWVDPALRHKQNADDSSSHAYELAGAHS